jgi:hypothetical protein
LYERAHANRKKKDVELKMKHQSGYTYALHLNTPIVAFICVRHNYTTRDAFDILKERVAFAKSDIDNSFKSY